MLGAILFYCFAPRRPAPTEDQTAQATPQTAINGSAVIDQAIPLGISDAKGEAGHRPEPFLYLDGSGIPVLAPEASSTTTD